MLCITLGIDGVHIVDYVNLTWKLRNLKKKTTTLSAFCVLSRMSYKIAFSRNLFKYQILPIHRIQGNLMNAPMISYYLFKMMFFFCVLR